MVIISTRGEDSGHRRRRNDGQRYLQRAAGRRLRHCFGEDGEDGFFQDQSAHEQFCSTAGFARKWPQFWHHGPWNEFGARITGGDMPTITTWISGVKFMEWTETEKRMPASKEIALHVHGGGDFTKQFVRYRNIRVKRLDTAAK
jgi:hypothetical protein